MANLEHVLAEALKLSPLDQVKLISTLAHRVEQEIRRGSEAGDPETQGGPPPLPGSY